MAAAIAAKPDMPVPTAATSVHPDPAPELPPTAITVTVGAAEAGLCPGFSAAGAIPVEGDGEAAIVAERAPVRAVTVTVTVTRAGTLGLNTADVTEKCGIGTVAVAVTVGAGENTAGGAAAEVAR
jgi:hypothetical protein